VAITVRGRDIAIQPIPPLRSRTLVENAMIMAGEAVAGFALEHDIPLPYATQDPPEPRPDAREAPDSSTLAGMYVVRRTLKRSQYRSLPAPHSGLGLPAYTQVTSPMRRYLDLVVHQQLRAYAGGTAASETSPGFPRARSLLSAQEILERVGAIEAVIGSLRQAEQLSDRHWTLAHLLQNPKWRGTGVLVDRRGLNGTVLIADLALENSVHLPAALDLNAQLTLSLRGVDLPHRDARFRVEGA
jgi:exoribonuclease-2